MSAPASMASNARVGKILEDFEDVELEPKTPLANRARFAFDGTDPVGSPAVNTAGATSGMGSIGGIRNYDKIVYESAGDTSGMGSIGGIRNYDKIVILYPLEGEY
jgi:hypothetical protein